MGVAEKMFQRTQHETIETGRGLDLPGRRVFFQQPGEERLGEILGIFRFAPQKPDMRIDRVPVDLAQRFQGGRRFRRFRATSRTDETPVRRGK